MAHFKRADNGFIYLYHWVGSNDFFRISTKMKVEQRNWDGNKQRPKNVNTTCKDRSVVNELLRYETALSKALVLQPELTKATLSEFKKLFQSILSPTVPDAILPKYSFLSYFKDYIDSLKRKGQSNYKYYNTCYNHLTEYFGTKKPTFDEIDAKFYNGFKEFMTSKLLSMNTIATRFKSVKAVMQSAYVVGLHKNEQFRHFKVRMESADTIYLNEEELDEMYSLSLTGKLDKARDYFITGAFTGLRFDDWDRVCSARIADGILSVRSSKTGELSTIPVHTYVNAILDKYAGQLPPKPSNQKMNEYIKIVAARAGISDYVETRITKGGVKDFSSTEKAELVTTHTARRSLATNLVLRGVSPYVVMKITGHTTLSNFERYVRLQELEATIRLKELGFFN